MGEVPLYALDTCSFRVGALSLFRSTPPPQPHPHTHQHDLAMRHQQVMREREVFIDNLLVRIH